MTRFLTHTHNGLHTAQHNTSLHCTLTVHPLVHPLYIHSLYVHYTLYTIHWLPTVPRTCTSYLYLVYIYIVQVLCTMYIVHHFCSVWFSTPAHAPWHAHTSYIVPMYLYTLHVQVQVCAHAHTRTRIYMYYVCTMYIPVCTRTMYLVPCT